MTQMYIADFRDGVARLAQVEVEKETPKTITIVGGDWLNLIDRFYYIPTRLNKGDYYIYDTEKQAISWLLSQAEAYRESLHKSLARSQEQIEELRGYLADDPQA